MNRKLITRSLWTIATMAGMTLSGCSTDVSEGDLGPTKPYDAAAAKEANKKVMEGMGGMYKGAPGAPKPKG